MAVGEVGLTGNVLLYKAAPLVGGRYGLGRTYAYLLSQGTATELAPRGFQSQPVTDGERVYWFQRIQTNGPGGRDRYYYRPYPDSPLQLFVAQPPASPLPEFADVAATHPWRTAIVSLAGRGAVGGYTQGTQAVYRPNQLLLRAQFAKIVAEALDLPVEESLSSGFTDMGEDGPGLYPHDYVAAVAQVGIVKGFSSSTFGPYQNVTRAQLVTMVVRAAEATGIGLLPVPEYYGPQFSDPVHGPNLFRARINGLLDGLGDYPQAWDPAKPASRGEAALIVWNLLKAQEMPAAEYWYW